MRSWLSCLDIVEEVGFSDKQGMKKGKRKTQID
jgi:hypothetical protein